MGNGIIKDAMGDAGTDAISAGLNMSANEGAGYATQQSTPYFQTKPLLTPTGYVPPDTVTCAAPDGSNFYAPPQTNWTAVHAAGQAGGWDPIIANADIGQFGTYDFQRDASKNLFMSAYTDASNFAVGVYMHGAGFSLDETKVIGSLYARVKSSNAGASEQANWWAKGWNAANGKNISTICQ